jgi:uncharacterized tellurite resistance protein B-like protein
LSGASYVCDIEEEAESLFDELAGVGDQNRKSTDDPTVAADTLLTELSDLVTPGP